MSHKPAVIVLGGGEDQVPAYLEARRRGFAVIGVDLNPHCLGAGLADEFLPLTSRDHRSIADAIGDRRIAAVISPASDAAQESVAALRVLYATPHQMPAAALRATVDKAAFHAVTEGLGFPTYTYLQSSDHRSLAERAATTMNGPLIVKPSDSSGSKGLSYVSSIDGLNEAIGLAAGHSHSGEVIVEEYIVGRHYSSESFLVAGEVAFAAVTDRVLTLPPHFISRTHIVPADIDHQVRQRFITMVNQIAAATGYRDGPLNADFILTDDDRLVLVEMGARLGGNGMPLLVRHAYGIDTVAAALDLALGRCPAVTPMFERAAMLHILGVEEDGELHAVEGLDRVRSIPEVVKLEMFKKPGERVQAYTQAGRKLGYLVLVARDREQLREAQARVLDELRFVVHQRSSPMEAML